MATTQIMANKLTMQLEQLDFQLPDFVRWSWVSDTAQDVWQPRFQRITAAWLQMEWLAVLEGVRQCSVTIVSPEQFVDAAATWAGHGLNALPVEIQGLSDITYASTSVKAELGKPFVYRVVVGSPTAVVAFKQAWDANDDAKIGRLLGYPSCCHAFFYDNWVEEALVDTTWPMAVSTLAVKTAVYPPSSHLLQLTGPAEANILWRWLGLRAVPHLPCSFNCEATVALGKQFIDVGRKHGFAQEMDWLLEILSWPVSWSALHGIAEIKTPLLKISTRTDATATKYEVQRSGDSYPAEGARGLVFPYKMPTVPILSSSNGYQKGLDNSLTIPVTAAKDPIWLAAENGFSSVTAMREAHKPIVSFITKTVTPSSQSPIRMLDLGCGNGALLQAIKQQNPQVEPFGLDIDEKRIQHARERQPEFAANFIVGDMFDERFLGKNGRSYDLVLLMPGRLLESSPNQATALKTFLKQHAQKIVVYAYGDWLTRYDNLTGLCQSAGLQLCNDGDAAASLAMVS